MIVEPMRVAVPLEGYDSETRAINAMVYLLNEVHFDPQYNIADGKLNPFQKSRVAQYLYTRYKLEKP